LTFGISKLKSKFSGTNGKIKITQIFMTKLDRV
jgi:hypothetical protein